MRKKPGWNIRWYNFKQRIRFGMRDEDLHQKYFVGQFIVVAYLSMILLSILIAVIVGIK